MVCWVLPGSGIMASFVFFILFSCILHFYNKDVFTFINRKKNPANDMKIKGRLAGFCILKHRPICFKIPGVLSCAVSTACRPS